MNAFYVLKRWFMAEQKEIDAYSILNGKKDMLSKVIAKTKQDRTIGHCDHHNYTCHIFIKDVEEEKRNIMSIMREFRETVVEEK